MRGQRGQVATEYLGVLVLICVTVGALVISGVDGSIERWMERSMCRILEGKGADCTAATPKRKAAPARRFAQTAFAAKSGPGFDGQGGAPFGRPGSVTFTGKKGKKGVRFKISASTSNATLDPSGCRIVTSSRSGAFELYGEASKDAKRFSASIEAYAGKKSTYEVSVGPRRAAQIKDGAQQPNPFDPRTIGTGESASMGESFYTGASGSVALNNIKVGAGLETGTANTSAVTRVDGNTMRLSVGDEAYIKRTTSIGLADVPVSISGDKRVGLANGRSLEVDISTDEGWNAYQTFVREGKLPDVGGRSISNSKKTETVKADSSAEAGLNLGPIAASVPLGSSSFIRERTTNPKGGKDTTVSWRKDDLGLQVSYPAGKEPVYAISVANGDKSLVEAFRRNQGLPNLKNRPEDVRLEFTGPQMTSLMKRVQALNDEKGRPLSPQLQVFVDSMDQAKNPLDALIAFAGISARKGGPDIMEALNGVRTALAAREKRRKGNPRNARFGARETSPRCPA